MCRQFFLLNFPDQNIIKNGATKCMSRLYHCIIALAAKCKKHKNKKNLSIGWETCAVFAFLKLESTICHEFNNKHSQYYTADVYIYLILTIFIQNVH